MSRFHIGMHAIVIKRVRALAAVARFGAEICGPTPGTLKCHVRLVRRDSEIRPGCHRSGRVYCLGFHRSDAVVPKLAFLNAESPAYLTKFIYGRVLLPALPATDLLPGYADLLGQLLLG